MKDMELHKGLMQWLIIHKNEGQAMAHDYDFAVVDYYNFWFTNATYVLPLSRQDINNDSGTITIYVRVETITNECFVI
jgi:hypothetical protein